MTTDDVSPVTGAVGDQDRLVMSAGDGAPPSRGVADQERRNLLSIGSTLLMAGGLASGYGAFFTLAARYLFPSDSGTAWFFVASASSIAPGSSLPFTSPGGVRVTITRRDDDAAAAPSVDSFLALSSVCPHLGCRVHWELQNDRFFCPCHNGVFASDGKAVSGPPAQAGQDLPRYPLQVSDGALYIEMPSQGV